MTSDTPSDNSHEIYIKSKHLLIESGAYHRLLHQLRTELHDSGYIDKLTQHLHTINSDESFNHLRVQQLVEQSQNYVKSNSPPNDIRVDIIHKIGDALQE